MSADDALDPVAHPTVYRVCQLAADGRNVPPGQRTLNEPFIIDAWGSQT